jgi:hypothetical protein
MTSKTASSNWRSQCRAQRDKTLIARYWEKVDKTGTCWLWTACKDKDGYGFFRLNGKNMKAHRLAFEWERGRAPSKHACHTCDTPSCVNPDHLWDGTNSENQIDAVLKRRRSHVRLHPEDVRRIREVMLFGANYLDIAQIYGISRRYVHHITSRRKWAHVD